VAATNQVAWYNKKTQREAIHRSVEIAIVADVKTGRVGNAPSSCYNLGLSRIRRSTRQHDDYRSVKTGITLTAYGTLDALADQS